MKQALISYKEVHHVSELLCNLYTIGKNSSYLGGIERGIRNPTLKNIEKIAKGLKVPPSELFEFNK